MVKRQNAAVSVLLILSLLTVAVSGCAKKDPSLSNANADENTKRIYSYIKSLNGNYSLSAQQESTWMQSEDYEIDYVYGVTGKYPAMRGFDYMNDDFQGVNERAAKWAEKGGLVTICWHTGSDFSGEWADAQNDEITNWELVFTEGTAENKAMLEGMDKAAKALKQLQDEGVTVIWRPFHEADGGWFWWGKGGAENFKKLWVTMYERYTDYWGLNNLIWVLGLSHNGENYKKWYVGDAYCDIIGADSYDPEEFPGLYKAVGRINKSGKPVCMHECGTNPSVTELEKGNWVWFMTWHTQYLTDSNTDEALKELYNSHRVITLDELSY